jgi:hypothetical protein
MVLVILANSGLGCIAEVEDDPSLDIDGKADVVSDDSEDTIPVGSVFEVRESFWGNVLEDISNANHTFLAGDRCNVTAETIATVVPGGEEGRVRARLDVDGLPAGSMCPNGAVVVVDIERFVLRSTLISNIPLEQDPNDTIEVGDTYRIRVGMWGVVVEEIDNRHRTFEPGDECAVESWSRAVIVPGGDAQHVRARIELDEIDGGTVCPDGALVDLRIDELLQNSTKLPRDR